MHLLVLIRNKNKMLWEVLVAEKEEILKLPSSENQQHVVDQHFVSMVAAMMRDSVLRRISIAVAAAVVVANYKEERVWHQQGILLMGIG